MLVISFMGAVAIIAKYYFKAIWSRYKNPVAFYKSIIRSQVRSGLLDEESITENFKLERPARWMIKQKGLWFELLLMLVTPFPYDRLFGHESSVIYIDSINWVDNGSTNNAHSVEYPTPYFFTDFTLALMFLRFYFFA